MTKLELAYRRWRALAERGYGSRDHSIEHMRRVDARIRKALEQYESLARKENQQ
jgi:hypothetical protein